MNGINQMSHSYEKIGKKNIILCGNVFSFFITLILKRSRLRSVIGMSDVDAMIAVAFISILYLRVPVLVGVFHPKQWVAMLDASLSKHRAITMNKFLDALEPSNIIVTSRATIDACTELRKKFRHGCHILKGPIYLPGDESEIVYPNVKSIVTVGRYVDFKVDTILAMIGVVEIMNRGGQNIEYHIYGHGPSKHKITSRIESSEFRDKFYLYGSVPLEDFRSVIQGHSVFFGMGTALFQAALAGIPAIIAIQGEKKSLCYGLITDYNHEIEPVFGDPTDSLKKKSIESVLDGVLKLDSIDWVKLATKSRDISNPFSDDVPLQDLRKAINNSVYLSSARITLMDLLVIRIETFYSRIVGRKGLHT